MREKRGRGQPQNEPTAEELLAAERAAARTSRKWRVCLLTLLLFAGGSRVMTRAYEIQIKSPESYERRYRQEIEVQAKRGNIYDRSGAELR